MNLAWTYLLLAGLLEVGFATCLRYLDGTWRPIPLLLFTISAAGSFYFLSSATRTIPMGTAYAVWTGIGAAGTAITGIIFYDEPAATLRIAFLMLLIGSIIGLKFVSSA